MIEITITTKAGKFGMTGPEMVERYEKFLLETRGSYEGTADHLADFLSTYEEEVKTEDKRALRNHS